MATTALMAETTVDYDHAINFGKYHTYSWIGVNVQEPLWSDRVTRAVDSQLTAKGWRKVASGGEAAVSAVGSSHTEETLDTWYTGGWGGGWGHLGWWGGGGPGYPVATIDRTRVGELHLDIFDSQSKKVIWHGETSGALSGKPEKNEKKLQKAVEDLFKKFPPPEKR